MASIGIRVAPTRCTGKHGKNPWGSVPKAWYGQSLLKKNVMALIQSNSQIIDMSTVYPKYCRIPGEPTLVNLRMSTAKPSFVGVHLVPTYPNIPTSATNHNSQPWFKQQSCRDLADLMSNSSKKFLEKQEIAVASFPSLMNWTCGTARWPLCEFHDWKWAKFSHIS